MRRLTTTVLAACALLGVGAAPALAGEAAPSPWWHLTQVTQPSYIQPGAAKQQIWRLKLEATAGSVKLEAGNYGKFTVSVGEPRNEVQAAIEEALRGGTYLPEKGRVIEVSSESGPYNKYETYGIKLTGELEYTHYFELYPAEEALSGGPAKMTIEEVSRGRSDGVIVLTATNLGDAPTAVECVKVAPGTGSFSSGACDEGTSGGEYEALPGEPITLADTLPPSLEAVQIEGVADDNEVETSGKDQLACSRASVSCTFVGGEDLSPEGLPALYLTIPPYEAIRVEIAVNVKGAQSGAVNEASVSGGGAPPARISQPLTISDEAVPFGAAALEMRPEEAGGALDAQAGSHPFQLTTTFVANTDDVEGAPAGGQVKDLRFNLPPGLIGNPTPFAQCTIAQFHTNVGVGHTECPAQSVVGAIRLGVKTKVRPEPFPLEGIFRVPLYNLEPGYGEPARFGFVVEEVPVELDTSVRTGGDYGVTVTVRNTTQEVEFITSEATFWGVPGVNAHDASRGAECLAAAEALAAHKGAGYTCGGIAESGVPPLLALPTYCPASGTGQPTPMQSSIEVSSWADPSDLLAPLLNTAPMPALDGCNRLPFEPSINVTPDKAEASKPTGINVDVHVNQESVLNREGLAEADVRDITVALPYGVQINPAGGNGLEACSSDAGALGPGVLGDPGDQVGFTGFGESALEPEVSNPGFTPYLPGSNNALASGYGEALQPGLDFCPDASKIAEVTIKSPLLPRGQWVKGFVYLAAQNANPFGSLIAMYILAEDPISGTVVKLPGVARLCEAAGEVIAGMSCEGPGQIISTFENEPQLPFEDAELHFFGGERAPLSSPAHCGTYTTRAAFTPWSGQQAIDSSSSFQITSGPNGTPCPGASLPFSPALTAGMVNNNGGAFSAFSSTIGREDGNQDMQSVSLNMPEGLTGNLSGVKLCSEAQANEGTCGPESLIGETTVSAGVGSDPVFVKGGRVYITEKYDGAPFGLSIVNPVKAGPFDLERDTSKPATNMPACDCVVVRAKIEVNPLTSALTVTTDPSGPYAIPHMIDGIPVQIKKVNVLINRPNFMVNPTTCEPMRITGAIASDEGASSPVSVSFEVANCANLRFEPKISISTQGHTSKADGASLTYKVAYPNVPQGTDADIHYVKVELPEQLPSRLTTLQKACTQKQFQSNPAGCPSLSVIGHAKAVVPNIPVPLEGPVYFVSNGGEAFPNLVMVLQGYGVTIYLVGDTYISPKGITSTTFHAIPDNPLSTFEITLPEGPYSALAANGNLCAETTTKTVKQKVTVRIHGRKKTKTRKVKETVPATVQMGNEYIGQNGAHYNATVPLTVTGCPKAVHKAKKGKKKKRGGKKKREG